MKLNKKDFNYVECKSWADSYDYRTQIKCEVEEQVRDQISDRVWNQIEIQIRDFINYCLIFPSNET